MVSIVRMNVSDWSFPRESDWLRGIHSFSFGYKVEREEKVSGVKRK